MRAKIIFALSVAAACVALLHCGATVLPAQYAAELEGCLQASPTCEVYVACRKAVAKKYGRTFEATCTAKDAGNGDR